MIIVANITAHFNLTAQILEAQSIPAASFNARRMQYDVGCILASLEEKATNRCHKIIGVLDVDLFTPVFTHILGEARQGGSHALVSLFRLKESTLDNRYDRPEFLTRTAKVALHELGHLFSLTHCDEPSCLMHYSGSAEELKLRRLHLCRYCRLFLQEKTAHIGG